MWAPRSEAAHTRGLFPALTANLNVRWCSLQLKIEVGNAIFRHDPRFKGRFLLVGGERAEESKPRERQSPVEENNATALTKGRDVTKWRAIHSWAEEEVWAIIKRWGIVPHPGYRLGFGRLSCMTCIFGDKNQWATIREGAPAFFARIAAAEAGTAMTIRAKKRQKNLQVFYEQITVGDFADQGCSFAPKGAEGRALWKLALAERYDEDVVTSPRRWQLPPGAFKKGGGPPT